MDKVIFLKIVLFFIYVMIFLFYYLCNLVCKSFNIYIEKDIGVYIGLFNWFFVLEINKCFWIDRIVFLFVGVF